MPKHKVKIIKKDKKISHPKVSDNEAHLNVSKSSGSVIFDASDSKSIIFFPNPILTYDRQQAPEQVIEVSKGTTSAELFVHGSAKEGKEYFYAVWVDEDNDFVRVLSYPSIIIDP